MLHIHIGIDPVFAHIGGLALTWHGLFSAIAIIVAVWLTRRILIADHVEIDRYDEVAFITVLGGILGARLFFFFDHPSQLFDDPVEFFKFTDGGLAIYGALIGGFVTVGVLSRIYHFSFGRVADAVAPGLLLAQAIGRIGCAINGDAWGAPTSSRFAFIYTNPDALLPDRLLGVPTHPYPVYDMLIDLALLAVIWRLRKSFPPGGLFALYAGLYAIARFAISEVREERVWFWGMQQAQVVSLVVLLLSLLAFAIIMRRGEPHSGAALPIEQSQPSAAAP